MIKNKFILNKSFIKYYSTNKKSYLTVQERNSYTIPQEIHHIIIGLLLGDLSAKRKDTKQNTHLYFVQGGSHEPYLMHLYQQFETYCYSTPKSHSPKSDKRTGKVYSYLYFYTYSLPCFNNYHELFYVNKTK